MNYELLFSELKSRNICLAITGAKGGFGRSLLTQCRIIPQLQVKALCDLDAEGTARLLAELGFAAGSYTLCVDREAVRAAEALSQIAIIDDHRLLDAVALDIIVEATGQPETSVIIALDAIRRGVHVAMVSKETDSVVGTRLNRLACQHNVVYTTVDGDQPSNLIGLVTWARVLGLEIIAAGKSSEFDYVFDPATNEIHYDSQTLSLSALARLWELGDDIPGRLAARSAALSALPQCATPDYCEMNVVANSTGLIPACDKMSYPLCHTTELADIFIPEEHGGILKRTGVVDVFNCLRRVDEPSFAGGVFIVFRCTNTATWDLLREKGHVVSRNGQYACIYLPYHFMGLEAPISLFSAVLHHRPSGARDQAVHAVMTLRTTRDFKAGEVLRMGGHQHAIEGGEALLLPSGNDTRGKAPFYLAANNRLLCDVPAATVVAIDMLDLKTSVLYDTWQAQLD